jgi:hypothetical protein
MAFFEQVQKATEPRHWHGDMEGDHHYYSAGVMGQRFFEALRDEGKLLGAYCPKCDWTYVPPRMYCERCFSELSELRDVGLRGCVQTFTVARVDKAGNPLDPPEIFAIIDFGPNTTGLLHKLGDVLPEDVCIGMEVEAVIKPKSKREGKITDIRYFRPVKST